MRIVRRPANVFPVVAVRHRRRRLVLVQAGYAGRLFGQAPVHYALQHILLLVVAAAAIVVVVVVVVVVAGVVIVTSRRRTHGQVTGELVSLRLHHSAVDRFHGHVVVALFVAAAGTTFLMTALVAGV